MGMAASQARYLSLVARKTNCEYEGQQINQSRLNLANQSANLFNQMLGLNVPIPPSVQDFTKIQYSFTDGINGSVIDKWEQLARPDDDGNNYIVEYHYNANVYTGFQKKMNDPQVQFSLNVPLDDDYTYMREEVTKIWNAQKALDKAKADLEVAKANLTAMESKGTKLASYRDLGTLKDKAQWSVHDISDDKDQYEIWESEDAHTAGDPADYTYIAYDKLTGDDLEVAEKALQKWRADGIAVENTGNLYYNSANGTFAFKDDLEALRGIKTTSLLKTLPVYHLDGAGTDDYDTISSMNDKLNDLSTIAANCANDVANAEASLEALNIPSFVGNCKLTSLSELSQEQMAEIKQIISDMNANGVNCDFLNCFDSSLSIDPDHYTGGIYSFERDGVTYYTTYFDLAKASYESTFRNDIDNQPKMNYYHANYVPQEINTVDKAILDTDSKGRFKTVRFASDGAQYTLNVEQITDDDAYQDAMNKYYYENAQYDKMIQDLNAKTSIIQQEDRTLELRLKQLDTEQNALSNEIEAVQKVVKDNVEKSFKTFSG